MQIDPCHNMWELRSCEAPLAQTICFSCFWVFHNKNTVKTPFSGRDEQQHSQSRVPCLLCLLGSPLAEGFLFQVENGKNM